MSKDLPVEEAKAIICRFLPREWPHVPLNEITLRKDADGYCNTIHFVSRSISSSIPCLREPSSLIIRHYGGNETFDPSSSPLKNTTVEETMIAWITSSSGIGPKVLGVFDGGRIEQMIPGGPLDPRTTTSEVEQEVARVYARFHALEPPMVKDKMSRYRDVRTCLSKGTIDKVTSEIAACRPDLLDKCSTLLSCDTFKEKQWLFNQLEEHDCHQSFITIDANYCNLVKRADGRRLAMIDYEFACYGYSCIDLGCHYIFQQLDAKNREEATSGLPYAGEGERRMFVTSYLEEVSRLNGGKEKVTQAEIDKWLRHTELGTMMSALIFMEMVISQADPALIYQQQMITGTWLMYQTYYEIKKRLFGEG